jgi:hypothetical protein
MNGSWIEKLLAPTNFMIPSSRRLESAESRIVVAMSKVAESSMIAAIPAAETRSAVHEVT